MWNQLLQVNTDIKPHVPQHLRDLFDRSTKDLNESQKGKVADLLSNYQDTFSRDE